MAPLTISQAFELPSRRDITAMGFVVSLQTDHDDQKELRLVEEYVLTPTVRAALPALLSSMQRGHGRREALGRFVHGSFGSGKSHFLSFVGLLLEDRDSAWGKKDPLLPELSAAHRAWVREAKPLVVRSHMVAAGTGREIGFDRIVYEAVNHALRAHGKAPFEFLNVDGVLAELRREGQLFGEPFWLNLAAAGIVGSAAEFEDLARGAPEDRELMALEYLKWKGRDSTSAGIDPNFPEGVQRLCAHVKAQGFGGLVLLIDEMLLWLSEKTAPEFKRAINQLTLLVDHPGQNRAIPLTVLVAQQRNISEFFPDQVQENALHEHLAHQAKRFDPIKLENVELRHICEQRVLRRRKDAAVEVDRVVAALAEQHRRILPTLLQDADVAYLRAVYPFHPALIQMLIDVSALMQRERTALRLLYELLVVHYPDLPLGEFLPVGSAFQAVFPESGVDGLRKADDLREIHRLYYQSLRLRMAQMAQDRALTPERLRALDQLVKTALLAEISPTLKAGGLQVVRLAQLNSADVTGGEMERTRMTALLQDLLELSRLGEGLQVSGTDYRTATVHVILKGVNFGELLQRARAQIDLEGRRQRAYFGLIEDALGLGRQRLYKREEHAGTVQCRWRGTTRRVHVALVNVRERPAAGFRVPPGCDAQVLIDYPWDAVGFSAENDRQAALDARRKELGVLTACWLPRHLSAHELGQLADLVAAEYLESAEGQEKILDELATHEKKQALEQAETRRRNMRERLEKGLGEIYVAQGMAFALLGEAQVPLQAGDLPRQLEDLVATLLDRRFPQHPTLGAEPKEKELQTLCDFLLTAAESGDPTHFNDAEGAVLRQIGAPLELCDLGQTRARLRRDSRYLKFVADRANKEDVAWDEADRFLEEVLGFEPALRSFFLALYARLNSYRVVEVSGETVDLRITSKPRARLRLLRAPRLELHEWSRLRELASLLFPEQEVAAHASLVEQDRVALALHERAVAKRGALQQLHGRLAELAPREPCARRAELALALARLAPLAARPTDSCAALRGFLGQWPEGGGEKDDPVVVALQRVEAQRQALEKLHDGDRRNLRAAARSAFAEAVEAHLQALDELLCASERARALTAAAIQSWNEEAGRLVERILNAPGTPSRDEGSGSGGTRRGGGRKAPEPEPEPGGKTDGAGHGAEVFVVRGARLALDDAEAVLAFWRDLRAKLSAVSPRDVLVDVVVRPADDEGGG